MILIFSGCSTDDTPPVVQCTPTPLAEPVAGWRFTTDKADTGLKQKWFAPGFDDSAWRMDITPGKPWEQQGLDYDGVGWFRARIALPAENPLWMAVSGVDDAAQLWIDGDRITDLDSALKLSDLSKWSGKTVTAAIRVVDTGTYGGVKDPVRIGGSPEAVLTRGQWSGWLASQHPDWPLPGWATGGPAAWAMTGGLNAADEALVSSEGRVAPWATAPAAMVWLVDAQSGKRIAPDRPPEFSLAGDHLPIPRWETVYNGNKVTSTLFFDETDHAVRWLIDVENTSNAAYTLQIAVTPFAANPTAHPITAVSAINPRRVWVNGQPYLAASSAPDRAGVGPLADVLDRPTPPDTKTLGCAPAGDGAAVLSYSVPSGQSRSVAFAFPASAGAGFPPDADANARLADATKLWEDQTSRVKLALPDGRIQGAFQASTGYMLLSLDPATPGTTGVDSNAVTSEINPSGPHPGPLAHDSLWVRDATYIGLALLQTGHADEVKAYLPAIWAGQSADGRVPPISGKSIPWNDDEWDAQGEAIFLTVATARYSGDTALLDKYYPQIKKAADFIRTLRARNSTDSPAKGLLPPSLSAEDLGLGQAHYYWDDFWAVAGLREAAYAANLTGHPEDVTWMSQEGDDLNNAIFQSIWVVMGSGQPYIPGSVEETTSSAAARGSVPALWPGDVFSADTPLVQRSFDYYHKTWIEPYGGGFLHRDAQLWPVGGLELAHAYLALGRGDVLHQILGWTLSHQTLPGAYAWADEVSPTNNGVAGGDMPHAWVAASYVTLIREMLIRERYSTEWDGLVSDSGEVDLFTLAPDGWFEAGNVVSVTDAPTWYGPLSIKTESTVQNKDSHWAGTLTLTVTSPGPTHPTEFVWNVPQPPSKVDGPAGTTYRNGRLTIPGWGGTVTLTFGP